MQQHTCTHHSGGTTVQWATEQQYTDTPYTDQGLVYVCTLESSAVYTRILEVYTWEDVQALRVRYPNMAVHTYIN